MTIECGYVFKQTNGPNMIVNGHAFPKVKWISNIDHDRICKFNGRLYLYFTSHPKPTAVPSTIKTVGLYFIDYQSPTDLCNKHCGHANCQSSIDLYKSLEESNEITTIELNKVLNGNFNYRISKPVINWLIDHVEPQTKETTNSLARLIASNDTSSMVSRNIKIQLSKASENRSNNYCDMLNEDLFGKRKLKAHKEQYLKAIKDSDYPELQLFIEHVDGIEFNDELSQLHNSTKNFEKVQEALSYCARLAAQVSSIVNIKTEMRAPGSIQIPGNDVRFTFTVKPANGKYVCIATCSWRTGILWENVKFKQENFTFKTSVPISIPNGDKHWKVHPIEFRYLKNYKTTSINGSDHTLDNGDVWLLFRAEHKIIHGPTKNKSFICRPTEDGFEILWMGGDNIHVSHATNCTYDFNMNKSTTEQIKQEMLKAFKLA